MVTKRCVPPEALDMGKSTCSAQGLAEALDRNSSHCKTSILHVVGGQAHGKSRPAGQEQRSARGILGTEDEREDFCHERWSLLIKDNKGF